MKMREFAHTSERTNNDPIHTVRETPGRTTVTVNAHSPTEFNKPSRSSQVRIFAALSSIVSRSLYRWI